MPLAAPGAKVIPTSSSVPTFTNLLVGSNLHSLTAAAKRAQELGYEAAILTDRLDGEAQEAAKWLPLAAAIPVDVKGLLLGARVPRAFIAGSGTTVTLKGDVGLGGGNQEFEFALTAALRLREHEIDHRLNDKQPRTVVLAAGTDGSDGPTDAAGAVVDALTAAHARRAGLAPEEYLQLHDSYHFFASLDATTASLPAERRPPPSHIKTKPTDTNVADVYLALTR